MTAVVATPATERTHTARVIETLEDGRIRTRITLKRCCNGCGLELGDATEEELELAVAGGRLPDVRWECPYCTPRGEEP